jgi:hypothetical protein
MELETAKTVVAMAAHFLMVVEMIKTTLVPKP